MRDLRQVIRTLAIKDGRFRADAFEFLFECLEPSIVLAGRSDAQGPERHITGKELLAGLCNEAKRIFGPLGAQVWRAWGVNEPMDWGHIVFLLVGDGLLNRRETDSIEDFRQDLDFEQFFVEQYEFELPAEIGPATA